MEGVEGFVVLVSGLVSLDGLETVVVSVGFLLATDVDDDDAVIVLADCCCCGGWVVFWEVDFLRFSSISESSQSYKSFRLALAEGGFLTTVPLEAGLVLSVLTAGWSLDVDTDGFLPGVLVLV